MRTQSKSVFMGSGLAASRPRPGMTATRSIVGSDARIDRALLHLVELGALFEEFLRLLGHARFGVFADLLGNFHRAEFRAAHRAEMRELRALGRQRLVMKLLGRLWIERQIELVRSEERRVGKEWKSGVWR